MKKQWKRLLIAALSSSSVFAATWFWYQSTADNLSSNTNEKPLAYVGKVVEDIQRRPAARLLWQLVNTGEPLYNGEAIRTSERGEVRIQFVGSDRYLDLEPESLIVIKKSEGEIALDLMEGSLFVNAKAGSADANAPVLVLNSANGKVDLSQASASLSKGRGNSVDVQVLEGKASIKSEDGQSKELTTRQEVKILSPLPQKPVAMDAENPEAVPFQWQGFPANSQVTLWTGPSRKQLKPLMKAEPNAKQVLASLPFGRHYWKLVATSQGAVVAESAVYKTEVLARYAPTMIYPTADADIPVVQTPYDMTFKWQMGEDTRQMSLELWSDEQLKNKVSANSFTKEDTFTARGLKAGTYYWRMTTYFTDTNKPALGKIQKFTLTAASRMKAKLEIVPVQINFTIPEKDLVQYFVDKPQLGLTWAVDKNEQVSSWRVKYHTEEEDPALAESIDIKGAQITQTLAPVSKPGRYIASIEALNKDGKILGTTSSKILTVSPLPLLQAPHFTPAEGTLHASMDGRTELSWIAVEGAKEYWLTIRKNGKELKRSKYMKNSTALKNLLPGEYEVELTAVDNYGRTSQSGPARKLLVPDKSNVRAPTLKKIKVN